MKIRIFGVDNVKYYTRQREANISGKRYAPHNVETLSKNITFSIYYAKFYESLRTDSLVDMGV